MLRIAIYFAPVWFVILFTWTLYVIAGIRVFLIERNPGKIITSPQLPSPARPSSNSSQPAVEAQVQPEAQNQNQAGNENQPLAFPAAELRSLPPDPSSSSVGQGPSDQDSAANSEAATDISLPSFVNPRYEADTARRGPPTILHPPAQPENPIEGTNSRLRPSITRKNAALSYVKYASFFFIALLVTWVGTAINPPYSPSSRPLISKC